MFVGIGLRLMSGVASFNPISLFAAGEPGVWYDPSDLTTIFQDNAGTTPVTAPGQTVGLMLDKSQGLVLGSELRGSGAIGIVGTATAATYNTTTGVGTVTRVDASNQSFVQWTGLTAAYCKVTVTCTSGFIGVRNGSFGGALITIFAGDVTTLYTPSNAGVVTITSGSGTAGFTLTSIKEAPGNHATQATSAQRPTYGINPIVGTRNLLTYTEQFDNAAWSRAGVLAFGSGSTANAVTSPDGATTADLITEDTATGQHILFNTTNLSLAVNTQHSFSCYVKAGTRTAVALQVNGPVPGGASVVFSLSTGLVTQSDASIGYTIHSSSITPAPTGGGWYRCSLVFSCIGTVLSTCVCLSDSDTPSLTSIKRPTYTGNGTSGLYIWGAQLELGSTATAYQKVVSQYEVTQAGVQSVSYLAFDGVDDNMVTPTITPNTNSVQVFAGVRKLGNTTGVIVESSNAGLGNAAGTFGLLSASGYLLGSQGTTTAVTTSSDYLGADTKVMTLVNTISADALVARLNGVALAINTADQGTGNYLAYPLNIGHRNTLNAIPFLGRLYSLITRFGANLTTGQITSTESWVNGKTGAY